MADDKEISFTPKAKHRFFYGYIVVILGFLIMMVTAGFWDSFGVFMKPLLSEFGWGRAMVSSSYSLSFLIFGLMGVIAGGLTDRFGPRLVLTFCGLFLGAGYLLMSQLSSLWQIFLFEGVLVADEILGAEIFLSSCRLPQCLQVKLFVSFVGLKS